MARTNLLKADTFYRVELIRDRVQLQDKKRIILDEDAVRFLAPDITTPGELEVTLASDIIQRIIGKWSQEGKREREVEEANTAALENAERNAKKDSLVAELESLGYGVTLSNPADTTEDATEADVDQALEGAEGSAEEEFDDG